MKANLILPMPLYVGSYPVHLIFIGLIFISACSIFKEKSYFHADSLLRHDVKIETKSESAMSGQALRIYSRSDSTDKQAFVEIFPIGPFRYSMADGFSGEAERLMIHERQKENKRQIGSEKLIQTSRMQSETKDAEKLRTETRVKEKDLNTSTIKIAFPYLSGLALIIFICFFRKYFRGLFLRKRH